MPSNRRSSSQKRSGTASFYSSEPAKPVKLQRQLINQEEVNFFRKFVAKNAFWLEGKPTGGYDYTGVPLASQQVTDILAKLVGYIGLEPVTISANLLRLATGRSVPFHTDPCRSTHQCWSANVLITSASYGGILSVVTPGKVALTMGELPLAPGDGVFYCASRDRHRISLVTSGVMYLLSVQATFRVN